MIDVDNLVVRLGQKREIIVRDISFSVEKGAVFGIVGESGCGKSTVLRAICGLNSNYEGDIRLDGSLVEPHRPKSFYRRVQMVFQDPYASLHPRKTIRWQLAEPLRNQKLPRAGDRIEAILEAVGLDVALSFRYPHQLSGGQRQRVAIARSLILEPDVLLLDEPTSALDVSVQAEILNLLCDLNEQRGLTYVLVSHDLAVISQMCDRVAFMTSGDIVEEVTVEHMRAGAVAHPYSQKLLAASAIYSDSDLGRQEGLWRESR